MNLLGAGDPSTMLVSPWPLWRQMERSEGQATLLLAFCTEAVDAGEAAHLAQQTIKCMHVIGCELPASCKLDKIQWQTPPSWMHLLAPQQPENLY